MSKVRRYVLVGSGDHKIGKRRERLMKLPVSLRRNKVPRTINTDQNPLIERAAAIIEDTYFLESWGLEGGKVALRSRVERYGRLLAQTEAFEATLTDEEKAALPMPERGGTAEGKTGA